MALGPTEKHLLATVRDSTAIAALIDPDNFTLTGGTDIAKFVEKIGGDVILIGGSTIGDQTHLDSLVSRIKKEVTLPVISFPGNITGISRHADAILFSSLLNSTNTYFIIGAQAIGAVHIRKYNLEAIPMGYLVFGEESTTSFVGQVKSIPYTKPEIAVMYALAAQYMGMRALYLEAGSGSGQPIPVDLVRAVKKYFHGILIVGGGITEPRTAAALARAGANLLVIGNLLENKNYKEKLSAIVRAVKGKP